MKTSTLLPLVGACARLTSAAVQFSFTKQTGTGLKAATVAKPRSTNANISYADVTYVVNATVGTPGQPVSLILSSSSSDTWVVDTRSDYCTYTYYGYDDDDDYYGDDDDDDESDSNSTSTTTSEYCIWGTFSPANSTSFELLDTGDDDDSYYYSSYDFQASYNDGSYAYGSYIADDLTLGTMSVSNLTMGLVNESSTFHGVLGIGYNDSTYDNLPDRLRDQGLITTTAYSLWVDDDRASSGNLLFGAIDTTKFDGNLTRIQSEFSYYQMEVYVGSINGSTVKSNGPIAITSNDSSYYEYDDYLFPAIYSPPDTVSNLPTNIASQIWDIAGAYFDADLSLAVISCTAINITTTNFTFQLGATSGGPIITATMADLVIPSDDIDLSIYYSIYEEDKDNMCLFGVQNNSLTYASYYNLGSTLLRRVYSVFDLVNNEIAIAPVKFDATATSNIVDFSSYGAVVPSSTLFCDSYCYESSSDPDGSDSYSDSTTELHGVLSVGALIGMSFGIALGLLALGIAGFLVWRHRRNNAARTKDVGPVSSAENGQAAPVMTTAIPAQATAPEMAQTSQATPAPTDKGKAPEIPPPSPLSTTENHPEADGAHDTGLGEPSSSRNA